MKFRRIASVAGVVAAVALLSGCAVGDASDSPQPSSSSNAPAEPALDGLSAADFPVVSGDIVSDTGQDGTHTVVVTADGDAVFDEAVEAFETAGYAIESSSSSFNVGRITASGAEHSAVVTIAGATVTYVFTAV